MSWQMGVSACLIEGCINTCNILKGQSIGWLQYQNVWMAIGCFYFCMIFFLGPVALWVMHIACLGSSWGYNIGYNIGLYPDLCCALLLDQVKTIFGHESRA